VDTKVVLCGLWISTLFVFAYVDIVGFWRADVINGALTGKVPGPGFEIDQTYLVLTTIYILVPSLMVIVSLLAPAARNRAANLVVSLTYLASSCRSSAKPGSTSSSGALSRRCSSLRSPESPGPGVRVDDTRHEPDQLVAGGNQSVVLPMVIRR
jgi:hypothetical protein